MLSYLHVSLRFVLRAIFLFVVGLLIEVLGNSTQEAIAQNAALVWSASNVSFTVPEGGSAPNQTITLTTTKGKANYTISENATWLTVSPATGKTPATLTLAVNASGLTANTYTATVAATASGHTSASFTVTLTVTSGGNQAPVVDGGAAQTITLPQATVTLSGTATDDGLPNPPATLTYSWSQAGGPGGVVFGTPGAATTSATFPSAGVYTLKLEVSDSVLTGSDTVVVTVNAGGGAQNQAPVVDGGAAQTITLPQATVTLSGTATDDGLPNPPATLTYSWSQAGGPGGVVFGTPGAATTSATFPSAGVYTLKLEVSDSVLTGSDTVVVTVNAGGASPVLLRVNAGGGQYTDGLGHVWQADTGFSGGSTFAVTQPISGTTEDPLYQSERWGNPFSYQFSVPNDTYEVTLHFAELWWDAPGQRVFDVTAEGQLIVDDLDLIARAGKFAAVVLTVPVVVSDGVLNLNFTPTVNNAKLSALEVRVLGASGGNQAPVVDGGAAQTITLPQATVTLSGTATDDGLPNPPATLTYSWSQAGGPGGVVFGTPGAATTSATFPSAGVYTLKLEVSDSALTGSDTVVVTVNAGGGAQNQAPVVDGGAAQTITLPQATVTLSGTATDDGLPNPPATLTYSWSQAGGPGGVVFGTPGAATTSATFPSAGVYTLKLEVSDSALTGSDTVVVTVNAGGASPVLLRVNAGGGQYTDGLGHVWQADTGFSGGSTFAVTQPISGTTEDPLYQSERWGNPFSYQFSVPNDTYEVTLHFAELWWDAPGQRVFDVTAEGQLIVDDLDLIARAGKFAAVVLTVPVVVSDGVLNLNFTPTVNNAKLSALEVRVLGASGGNQAPVVDGGAAQTITLPQATVTLSGTATDDGLPNPPATLTYSWSQAGGPGGVVFGTPGAATTSATFPSAGVYTLKLEVSDSALTGSDTVVVTVNAGGGAQNQAPVVDGGAAQTITLPQATVTLSGTATDDGLPNPPATLTYSWSQAGGPGGVVFGTPGAATTSATFPSAGVYTLKLEVSDSALTGSDTVVVTVNAGGASPVLLRVNAGGGQYTDGLGHVWQADTGFSGGSTFAVTQPISGTTEDPLYQSERWGNPFSYQFSVPNDTYEVTLHFAELWWDAPGQRVFDVTAEGQLIVDDLDLIARAGKFAAVVLTVPVVVSDGVLNLNFTPTVNNAKLSALEVRVLGASGGNQAPVVDGGAAQTITLPQATVTLSGTATDDGLPNPPATLTYSWSQAGGPGGVVFGTPGAATTSATFPSAGVYTLKLEVSDSALTGSDTVVVTVNAGGASPVLLRVNAGGGQYTDGLGHVWQADTGFSGGSTFAVTQPISGTTEDPLYQSERWGNPFSYQFSVPNDTYEVTLHFAELWWDAPGQRVFDVTAEGQLIVDDLDIFAQVGKFTAFSATADVTVTDGVLNLGFTSTVDNAKVAAIEVKQSDEHVGHPFLHVVINAPPFAVDYDGNGSEIVSLVGSASHTHELGHNLTGWKWTEGTTILGTAADVNIPLGLGNHPITLTIQDDNIPPETLSDSIDLPVYPLNAVGGLLAQYYPVGQTSLATLIDNLPATAGFTEVVPSLRIDQIGSKIGNSPYSSNVVTVLSGNYFALTSGTYEFVPTGGSISRIFVDGNLVSGPKSLTAGTHAIEVRFGIGSVEELPVEILLSLDGTPPASIIESDLTHDETNLLPFINSMPTAGSPLGGEQITINGIGFFPVGSVTLHWGSIELLASEISVSTNAISLSTPPGSGTVMVTVETPNGVSNAVQYSYQAGTVPVSFQNPQSFPTTSGPTQAAWGPDGRLYVGFITGLITAYTFGDNYNVINSQAITTLTGFSNNMILGIGFNPFDPPNPVRIYVSHSKLFANGGSCFSGVSPYSGQVSVIEGPNFSAVEPLITQLPVSNHDHGINGLQFDNSGDLLIAVGGNTNAGIKDCDMGDLPESPLSAAVLRARLSKLNFNGNIQYVETDSDIPNNDQVFGDIVDTVPSVGIEPLAVGLRNPFDLVFTTQSRLYTTDNGPNAGFGAASTSATTQGPDPDAPDELNFVQEGHYYGHPNRNRGRYDDRQNVYHGPTEPSVLGNNTAPLITLPPSSNGIDEYRATTFNSKMRGELLVQQWNGVLNRVKLSADGSAVTASATIPNAPGALDVLTGPGGVIIGIDHSGNKISILKPNDQAIGMAAYDIFPWRATSDGTTPFTIGGIGFGNLTNTTVTIGGTAATLTSVSPTRIKGLIPAEAIPAADLLDVVVNSGGQSSLVSQGFRYVFDAGLGLGTWQSDNAMPISLGEVAAGVINGVIYVVGEGSPATLAFNIVSGTWTTNLAPRPFTGHHHAAEVIDGKLYLFGGLHDGSEGKVQIYDPETNTWNLGADIPFASGSASSAYINGLVYYAGGIIGNATTALAAVYDPVADAWSMIASMPVGRNHAASGTEGQKFYIFGGRGPGSGDGNFVAEGFDDVLIYDPATNTWKTSFDPGTTIPPLPQKRGGMGKAAYFRGEFYVMGGETTPLGTGQVAGDVYDRVDVYDPVSQTWRQETSMITARHGIFPVVSGDKIFVPGGGTSAGNSQSSANEFFQ